LNYLNAAFASAPVSLQPGIGLLTITNLKQKLRQRGARLRERIEGTINPITVPSFVIMEENRDEWIFRVPVYTDIEDRDFIALVKQSIERLWQLNKAGKTYRVEIDVSHIPISTLYTGLEQPAVGESIDLADHLTHFPANGAILTTGGLTTHVENCAIVLGALSISPRILAHEFGHVLGFRDRYIRGYRDLGRDGFEIMETVTDTHDIMGAPEIGSVLPRHFELLMEAIQRNQRLDPLTN
jgi:hypothetical protein